MGAGASAESARTTVAHMLTGKPADASDIKVSYDGSFALSPRSFDNDSFAGS